MFVVTTFPLQKANVTDLFLARMRGVDSIQHPVHSAPMENGN